MNREYKNGYAEKIQYWVEKLGESESLEVMERCMDKINYFSKRQNEWIITQKINENKMAIN